MTRASVFTLALTVASALGCGASFVPPAPPTTGVPAAELGQVVDADVSLPFLSFPQHGAVGASLSIALDVERDGAGQSQGSFTARVNYQTARVGAMATTVDDVSGGRTTLTVAGESWSTGRIGPIEIEGTTFEFTLRGTSTDGGWTVAGESWESQNGQRGPFNAWRRHRFLVAASDFFAAGRIDLVELSGHGALSVTPNVTTTSPDAVLSQANGSVFAVNRLSFDNVQRLDPERQFATAWQAGTGQGSNPHDALLVSDSQLYVTRYEPPFNDVAVLLPQGGAFRASIPLESLATNADQTPRADRIAMAGGMVFVGLQNIDRTFTRYGDGVLAVIDPATDTVAGEILLPGKNPGRIVAMKDIDGRDKLYVAMAGIFSGLLAQELSGGVAVVDVNNRVFERWALDDDAAGGNVAAMTLFSPHLGVAVVSTAEFVNKIVTFDPSSAEVKDTLFETSEFVPEIDIDAAGVLALPDRSFGTPGLCMLQLAESGPAVDLGCARLSIPPAWVLALD